MTWQFTIASDIGDREQQQDRVAVLHSADNSTHLLVVADGMGGHEDGARAAQTVVDIVVAEFDQGVIDNPRMFLEKTCLEAHKAIVLLTDNRQSAPGSTCVILYLTETEAYWVHVGDSRLYQFHDKQFVFKTKDHSLAELMQETVPQNQLYMCLGGNNEVTPETDATKIRGNDFFLLCSDGLWGQLDVEDAFSGTKDAVLDQQYAEQLLEQARQQRDGNSDNICLAWAYWQGPANSEKAGFLKRLKAWAIARFML